MNDLEIANALADRPEVPYVERLTNWSPEYSLLAQVFDRLGSIMNAIVVMNGGKQIDIKPLPRPVTEIQRARERGALNSSRDFVARMTNRDHS